ncbi:MAG: adenylate kinase [Bacteroidota bacterium]
MLNLVLFGPPGAGKGTQSEKLIEKYKLVHLSTGDILRGELAAKTKLGKEAKKFMEKGELVPDSVVIGMIESKIDQNMNAPGFIFDGFPRTTAQATALDEMLSKKGTSITLMVALEVEHDELVKRLLNRGKDSGRADDKDESVIENRINVYHKETSPVIDYYDAQGKFRGVDGMGSIDEIFVRICNVVDAAK